MNKHIFTEDVTPRGNEYDTRLFGMEDSCHTCDYSEKIIEAYE